MIAHWVHRTRGGSRSMLKVWWGENGKTSIENKKAGHLQRIENQNGIGFSIVVVVQSLRHALVFVIPWTAACQASFSFIISQSLLKSCPLSQRYYLTISSSVIPFSSCLQSFPASGFSNESALPIRWPKLELQLKHQSFQWRFKVDFLLDWLVRTLPITETGMLSSHHELWKVQNVETGVSNLLPRFCS